MINQLIDELLRLTQELKNDINLDIDDVRKANHESLLQRNSKKLDSMEKLSSNKVELNKQLAQAFRDGEDVTVYKESIDRLEFELKELYQLNGKLASIVLPVREMYREIIDEITQLNGGSLVEVMA